MVDGADAAEWSAVAPGWAQLWGSVAHPVRAAIIAATVVGPGTRVLDAGCGSGEFLRLLASTGADAVGADPAAAMVEIARGTGVQVVRAGLERLPFAAASFDVATAVNALQFADDTLTALRELARVVRPGGLIAVANWAEGARNDLDAIESVVAAARDEDSLPEGPLRSAGGIEAAFTDAGLEVVESGLVSVPWVAADETTLVRGILLGEDAATMTQLHPIVVGAAQRYRDGGGRFVLHNAFRWAISRVAEQERPNPRRIAGG